MHVDNCLTDKQEVTKRANKMIKYNATNLLTDDDWVLA